MFYLQSVCWITIVGGFIFGMSDRWLSGDLFSLGVALSFSILVIPLCPLFHSSKR